MIACRNIAQIALVGSTLVACGAFAHDNVSLTFEPYTFTARSGESVETQLGTLTVPYDRSDPSSESIELKFALFPATTDNPGPPLVYLAGGPGGTGFSAARGPRFELFNKLRQLGDVIAWNQRGTGPSEFNVRIEATFDIPLEGALKRQWLEEQYAQVAREARAQFERDGFDPAPLNTNASADDLEDLRVALGVEKLRLWSISYGTHLALATVKRHPDAIDSMVLAGVEGLDSSFKLPSQAEAPVQALSREIAAHPVYGDLIPDFLQLMREVLERAEREPYAIQVEDPETGKTVTTLIGRLELERFTWWALKRRDRMKVIPATYLSTKMGMLDMLRPVVKRNRGANAGGGGNAMSYAMDCASGVSPDRLAQIMREEPGSLLGGCMNYRMLAWYSGLGIPDLGESFRAPVRSHIPVLCISGELDVRTPPSNAETVLKGFPNGHHLIIERAGHDNDLWVSSPKIAECINAFFNGKPIPHERIELAPIEFIVPPALVGGE